MPPSPTGTALVPGCGGPQPPAGRTQPHGDSRPLPPRHCSGTPAPDAFGAAPPLRAGPGRGSPGSGQRAPEAAPAGPGPATGGRAGAALCVTAAPSPSPAAHQLSSSSSSSDWVLSELQCRHHMAGPGRSGGRGAGQRHHSRPAAQPRPAPARSPQRPRAAAGACVWGVRVHGGPRARGGFPGNAGRPRARASRLSRSPHGGGQGNGARKRGPPGTTGIQRRLRSVPVRFPSPLSKTFCSACRGGGAGSVTRQNANPPCAAPAGGNRTTAFCEGRLLYCKKICQNQVFR